MKKQLTGSLYIMASAVFFGSYGIWSKMMSGTFDDFFQGWTRALIIMFLLLPIGRITKSFRIIASKDIVWFVIYAFPGSLVIPLYYYAFTHLSIGTATLSFYASLTITGYILGFMFFHERKSWVKIVSLMLGIGGLCTIYWLSVSIDQGTAFPLLVSVLAGICGGIEVVFTKKLSDHYSPIQLTFFLYAVSFVICFILSLWMNHFWIPIPVQPIAWIGTIMHAIASLFAFLFVVAGYKRVEPSIGGVVGLLEILFGILFGIVLFGEPISQAIVIGGILILLAAALPNILEILRMKR